MFYSSQGVSKLEHEDNDNYEEAEGHHQPHLVIIIIKIILLMIIIIMITLRDCSQVKHWKL